MAISAGSGSSLCFAPLPIFTGTDYKYWKTKMTIFFISQDLWDMVQNGQQGIYQEKRKDALALYYIQQAVAPTIDSALSANTAWAILDAEYNIQAKFLDDMDFHGIEISEDYIETSWPKYFISKIIISDKHVNPAAYTPQLISIGPIHHGRPELANMEKHKFHYAKNFLERTYKQKNLFVHFIKECEQSLRDGYSMRSDLNSRDYVEMILLDSFFIFELILRHQNKHNPEYADDPLLHHEEWFKNSLKADLLLIENQLPFRLLSELYRIAFDQVAFTREHRRFVYSCVMYFDIFHSEYSKFRNDVKKYQDQFCFTGFVRRSLRCTGKAMLPQCFEMLFFKFPAKKLSDSRVKFSHLEQGNLTDISFEKGLLNLPIFKVDNTTERIYFNLITFEDSMYKEETYFCSYILFLSMLIRTRDDVAVLIEEGVIINNLDSNQAVVDMIQNLYSEITTNDFCFFDICKELNHYCSRKILEDDYFSNIWRGAATIVAVILVLLTLIQTITSIMQVA